MCFHSGNGITILLFNQGSSYILEIFTELTEVKEVSPAKVQLS